MAPRPDVSLNSPNKPSRLLALIALVIAFALPFILVKTFPHKNRSLVDVIPMSLPVGDESELSELSDTTDSPELSESSDSAESSAPALPLLTRPEKIKVTSQPPQTPQTPKIVQPVVKSEWRIIKTRARDSLANIFSRAGVNNQTLRNIMRETSHTKELTHLKPDQELQLLLNGHTLEKLIIPLSTTHYLIIYLEKDKFKSKINKHKMNSHNHFLSATVQGSLYTTAKRHNIPYKLIRQMTEIFTWDINFARDIRAGDQFTIIYKAFYIENKLVSTGDIIAVSYKNRGKTYEAIRHLGPGGRSEYFTPQGKSLKKAFTRYPLHFSHISSSFSLSRYHPILHYRRAHKGIDLAARIGTPIQATGDGRIEIIGRQSGYGNMIKIKHSKSFSSVYGHMLKFQKGLSRGSFVKRGQVIGYVGQTGLASGPHCHYEFHINNQPRNPTTIDLPRGESVTGRELARFRANANTLLAQLKNFEQGHRLASSSKTRHHRG